MTRWKNGLKIWINEFWEGIKMSTVDYKSLAGMNLIEGLKKIENDTIKICCDNGSSFWYVGDRETFIENVDKLSMALKVKYYKTHRKREFVELKDRTISDVFDAHCFVDDSTVIYINGDEIGDMWFVGEFPDSENGAKLLRMYEMFRIHKNLYFSTFKIERKDVSYSNNEIEWFFEQNFEYICKTFYPKNYAKDISINQIIGKRKEVMA